MISDMQIDPATVRNLAELQNQTAGNPAALASNRAAGGNSLFDGILNGLISGEAPVQEGTRVKPGVTWEDGLLWQQLDAIAGQEEEGAPSADFSVYTPAKVSSGETSSVPTSYEDLISSAGQKYGVPEALIKAVIDIESSFNPRAVSSAGAKGLMQLMDGTARGLGVSDSFDPLQNIEGGTKYLSYQLQRFGGEVAMALAAYNAGPSRVLRLGVSNDAELLAKSEWLPAETQAYIRKVMTARAKYEA